MTENRFSYLSVWLPKEFPTEGRVVDIPDVVILSKTKISSRQKLFEVIGKGEGEDSLRSTCTQHENNELNYKRHGQRCLQSAVFALFRSDSTRLEGSSRMTVCVCVCVCVCMCAGVRTCVHKIQGLEKVSF